MQSRIFSRPCVAVFGVFLGLCGDNVRANSKIPLVPVAGVPTWLRQSIRINGPRKSSLTLSLTATGAVTAYFNGQRLVKNTTMDGGVITWDVTSLSRPGENCLAVSVTPDAKTATRLGAACFHDNDNLTGPSEWKIAGVAPPVGWQQTDFNDRDWKSLARTGTLN
ncbi:MAG: hypothetical protein GY826_28605, partial [Fuerstiella sp.]|nr:hypothetical protein [Fuerstiella sp.]